MMGAWLIACWIEIFSFHPLPLVIGINLGLPELECDINPGELLLAGLSKFHEFGLWIDHKPNEFFIRHHVKQGVIDGPDIIALKTLLSCRSHDESGSSERAPVVVPRADAPIIKAHLTVVKSDCCAKCLNAISHLD